MCKQRTLVATLLAVGHLLFRSAIHFSSSAGSFNEISVPLILLLHDRISVNPEPYNGECFEMFQTHPLACHKAYSSGLISISELAGCWKC